MDSVTITNATNGAIVTVTTFHRSPVSTPKLVILAVLAVVLIATGLYLLLRKEKTKRA